MLKSKKPELLAPAGSLESLRAAVQNGCDAVYLGGKAFGARAYAENFSREELQEALNYAHVYGVRVYVTVNTLYKDEELEALLRFVSELYEDGVDGIILQDLGAAQLLHRVFPDLGLHASTQMTVHNLEGARYLAGLGFTRVVLARELGLAEIKEIVDNVEIEVETFIHGALCISYSGQCLMSSLIGGRSGNRGRCAQPCRLPYELIDRDAEEVLGLRSEPEHLLSPKDICTVEILPELIRAGICSFKIEGRLKRPEYTAAVTRVYRQYLDLAEENPGNYHVQTEDIEELMQVFNRGGFSTGYFKEKTGSGMMSYGRPKNWGIYIGEVLSYDERRNLCEIKLTGSLKEGDGVEIWTDTDENAGTVVGTLTISGEVASFPIKGKINPGDPVYRTSQKELLDELVASYQGFQRKIDIFGHVTLKPGELLTMSLWDENGNYIQVESEERVVKAEKQPVSKEKIVEQVGKLGNLPFNLADVSVEMDEDVFLPISKLNALRRAAVEKLEEARLARYKSRQMQEVSSEVLIVPKAGERRAKPELAVYLNGNYQPERFIRLGVKRLYLNIAELTSEKIAQLKNIDKDVRIFAVLPRIARKEEMERVREKLGELANSKLEGYLAGNLGEMDLLQDTYKAVLADFSLNIYNKLTVNHWLEAGVRSVTISPELNLREMVELLKWVDVPKEVIVYGHLPSMISEYCPVGAVAGGFGVRKRCSRPRANYGLRDRLGHVFPVLTNCRDCRSVILNPQPLFMLDELESVFKAGFDVWRMDLTVEEEGQGLQLVKTYMQRLADMEGKLTPEMERLVEWMQKKGFTRGHFYRGVE